MTTLVDTPVVGLEDLQRAAFYVFFETYNRVLDEVSVYWQARDEIFDTRTGRTTAPTELEPIPPDNFHEGHKPSLILSGPDSFPNLTVFATRADPASENDQLDQMSSWSDSLLIEIMVKALEEDTVNRRIQRATEAAMICTRQNPTLGGAVTGFQTAPTVAISDVFAVRTDATSGGYGQRYIWQGSQITFRIVKDSVDPPPIGSIFQNSSQTDYGAQIDQG